MPVVRAWARSCWIAGAEASGRAATRSRNAPSTRGSSTRDTANCGMTPAARAARCAGTVRAAAAPAGSDAPSAARVAPAISNVRRMCPRASPPEETVARATYRPGGSSRTSATPSARTVPRSWFIDTFAVDCTSAGPSAAEAISNTTSVPSSESRVAREIELQAQPVVLADAFEGHRRLSCLGGGHAHEQRTETEQRPERHLVCVRAMIHRSHVAGIVHDREPHGVGAGRDGHVDREGQAIAGRGAELLFSRDDLPALLIAQSDLEGGLPIRQPRRFPGQHQLQPRRIVAVWRDIARDPQADAGRRRRRRHGGIQPRAPVAVLVTCGRRRWHVRGRPCWSRDTCTFSGRALPSRSPGVLSTPRR